MTAKQIERTTRIMTGLLSPARYATVVYLTAPAAQPMVLRAVASLPAADQARVAVRDLPANAFNPKWPLAGHRRVLDTARRLAGNAWGDEGLTRQQRAWVADPELIRRLDVGQACYIHRGAATFVRVAKPRPSPLSLPAARAPVVLPTPRPPEPEPVSRTEPGPRNLDNVLGPRGPW